jgi:hypothetical protein
MTSDPSPHLFVLGKDYHLGDLLWFTAVLREYRRQRKPDSVLVACPDLPVNRILEHNPLIDVLLLGDVPAILKSIRERHGDRVIQHDLRIVPIAVTMVRQWRRRLPWLYYRDLWFEARGQWLATFLGLGRLGDGRPVIGLREEDRELAGTLPTPCALLAPHIGQYSLSLTTAFWRRTKGWADARWAALADLLSGNGYQPITLAAQGQTAIPGTMPLIGHPIRQVAGVIEAATALITVESGLWFLAAALGTPFVIVPWWLPRAVNWPASMDVPHRLVYRERASVSEVWSQFSELVHGDAA